MIPGVSKCSFKENNCLLLSGDSILQRLYYTTNPLIEGFNLVSTASPRV